MRDRIQSAFSKIRADNALIESTAAYLRMETERSQHQNRFLTFPKLAGAFAVAAVFIVCIFAQSLYFFADAYVSIDVNPSIELTINRFNRVIGTHAFNEDGSRILNKTRPRGKSYDEAAAAIVSAIKSDGYLTEDSLVSVTVLAASGDREKSLCDALGRFIDEQILSIQATAEVEVFPVTEEVWGNAHGCNISPAKYLAIQELIEVDEEATVESYSDSTISQIRRRTQECHNSNTESGSNNYESDSWNEHEHMHGQGNGNGHGYNGGH